MKVLITGANGQLGQSLRQTAPHERIASLDCPKVDITDPDLLTGILNRSRPDVIINTAAYTAVDDAESNIEVAYAVNAHGPEMLAEYAARFRVRLIHISTDFVFSGTGKSPYFPSQPTHPLSIYGNSKLQGERNVLQSLPDLGVVIRSAWLYSVYGSNFVLTMLRLMRTQKEINVVGDQIGTPTWAHTLAQVIWKTVENTDVNGVLHWTDAGQASWYDFAVAVQQSALTLGLLSKKVTLNKVSTDTFPAAAQRPKYSVLDCVDTCEVLEAKQMPWQDNLRLMLSELNHHE